MSTDLLLAYFNRISNAPDAVPRLRRFILDLAVRGKLMEQDPADETAAELIKRVHANYFQKSARVRVQGTCEPSATGALTPCGWAETTLGQIADKITDGTHQTPTYVNEGIPFVSVKDFSSGRLDLTNTRFISREEHALLFRRCDPRRGDILIGRIGTLGKAVLVETDVEFSFRHQV